MGFFDEISKKVSQTTNSIQETTNKMQRESKCKKTIIENNSKIEKLYSEIGKTVYDNRKVDEALISYIEQKTKEIDTFLKENEELNKEILTLNNKKICPNCKAEVDIKITFCPQCGAEQEKIEIKPVFIPNGKRQCKECGELVDAKSAFCPNCGAKKEEQTEPQVALEEKAEEKNVELKDIVPKSVEISQSVEITQTEFEAKQEQIKNIEENQTAIEINKTETTENESVKDEKLDVDMQNDKPLFVQIGKRYCLNCGGIMNDDDVFCPNCGTKNEETKQ